MSTYWNPETGKYENFEMTVIQKMKNVADKLEEVAGDQIEVVAGIRYDTDEQGLTDAQKENARANIDAVSSEELASGLGDLETEISADVEKVSDDVSSLKNAITETTKNLFDVYALSPATNITNSNGVLIGTAGAFASAYGASTDGISSDITFESNVRYTFSAKAKNRTGGDGQGIIIRFVYSDSTTSQGTVSNATTTYTDIVVTSQANKTVSKIIISYASESGLTWDIKDIQIEKGTEATNYEKHISATDSNAREKIDNIKLVNAVNVFNLNKPESTKNSITMSVLNGKLNAQGTASANTYFDLYATTIENTGFIAGKTYYFDTGLRNINADGFIEVYYNDGNGNTLAYDYMVGIFKMVIPTNTQSIIIRYYINSGSIVNVSAQMTASEFLPNDKLSNNAQIRFLQAFNIGDCTIIKFKNGETLVIDFGINEPQGTLQASWNNAINELNLTHIDYAIISHYHSDHCGMLLYGINSLIDENTTFFLPNGHAFTSAELEALAWVDERATDDIVDTYTDVMTVLTTAGCKLVYPSENDVWWIGGAEIKFWNANMTEYMTAYANHTAYDYNDCSLCNYLTIGTYRIAFTGDASEIVCEKYKTSVLQCQILKAMHHAVGYNIVSKFMNSVMPDLSVTMLGYNLCHSRFGTSKYQEWCENNFVPNVATGINEKTLSLNVSENGWKWNTSCRRLICADEGIPTT